MLIEFLMSTNYEFVFFAQAFSSLCDLFIVFGNHLGERQPKLRPLVLEVEGSLPSRLITFIRDNVFVEAEEGKF